MLLIIIEYKTNDIQMTVDLYRIFTHIYISHYLCLFYIKKYFFILTHHWIDYINFLSFHINREFYKYNISNSTCHGNKNLSL